MHRIHAKPDRGHVCNSIYIYICIYIYMCIYIYVYIYIICVYIYIYIYIRNRDCISPCRPPPPRPAPCTSPPHKQSPCKPQTISVKVSETSNFRRKKDELPKPRVAQLAQLHTRIIGNLHGIFFVKTVLAGSHQLPTPLVLADTHRPETNEQNPGCFVHLCLITENHYVSCRHIADNICQKSSFCTGTSLAYQAVPWCSWLQQSVNHRHFTWYS